MRRRQSRERRAQACGRPAPRHPGLWLVAARAGQRIDVGAGGVVVDRDERRLPAGAKVIDDPVMRERIEPARETRARRVAFAPPDHPHPDVLEHLVGGRRVGAMTPHVAIHAAPVTRVQDVEGRGVAVRISEHQLLVACIVGSGRAHRAASMRARAGRGNPTRRDRPRRCRRW